MIGKKLCISKPRTYENKKSICGNFRTGPEVLLGAAEDVLIHSIVVQLYVTCISPFDKI